MNITGKLTVIEPTENGISRSTGEPWQSKNIVVKEEASADNAWPSAVAIRVFDAQTIKAIEKMVVGDTVKVDFRLYINSRVWRRPDGSEAVIRSNEPTLRSIELISEGAF